MVKKNSPLMEMLASALVVMAGVVIGPWVQGVGGQLVRASLEDECYNVGSCTPLEEPQGDQQEICRIFEESLSCMKSAIEACRQLDFPPDTVHLALDGVRFLREDLKTYCSDRHLGSSRTFADTANDPEKAAWEDEPERQGLSDGLRSPGVRSTGNADAFMDEKEEEEEEEDGLSTKLLDERNSGNRLPFPAIWTTLVVSLLSASILNIWITTVS